MNERLINDAKEYIKVLFEKNSDGHDLAHSLRVYSNAMKIAETEPGCDIEAIAFLVSFGIIIMLYLLILFDSYFQFCQIDESRCAIHLFAFHEK